MMRKILFLLLLLGTLHPAVGPALALAAGAFLALTFKNPWPAMSAQASKILLQLSVVGLGFGLSITTVLAHGRDSVGITIVGIAITLLVGKWLGRLFGVESDTSSLISFGTAICGGSAIAAMAPVLKARDDETAIALATIFTLNAVALLLFPLVGHLLKLDQALFGTWAGLAIHDTSSVVGAASAYGAAALTVGTTVKLTRAVWITPVVMGVSWIKGERGKVKIPLFIVGFLAAATLRTLIPQGTAVFGLFVVGARRALVATLFLIGAGLGREVLARVGLRPLLQGVALWAIVGSGTLAYLLLTA